jgi:hypothetical protein
MGFQPSKARLADQLLSSILSDPRGTLHHEVNFARRSTGADWRFTTTDARIKLKSLYPSA